MHMDHDQGKLSMADPAPDPRKPKFAENDYTTTKPGI